MEPSEPSSGSIDYLELSSRPLRTFDISSRQPDIRATRAEARARGPALCIAPAPDHTKRPAAGADGRRPDRAAAERQTTTGEGWAGSPAGPRGHEPSWSRGAYDRRFGVLAVVAG